VGKLLARFFIIFSLKELCHLEYIFSIVRMAYEYLCNRSLYKLKLEDAVAWE